jgi:predicted metal-dependent peptidase
MPIFSDPKNLSPKNLNELEEKLSIAKARMARSPAKGGMPFVYAFIATKEHKLWDEFPKYIDEDGQEKVMETASTNGKVYNWHPNFLSKLNSNEMVIVLAHETYHIVMQHCCPQRTFGKNPMVWNLAVDYVVNAAIEHDLRVNGRANVSECDRAYQNKDVVHPIWKDNLGKPYKLKDLLKNIEESYKNKDKKIKEKKEKHDSVVYADFSLHGRSAESIYDEIMGKVKKCGGQGDLNDLLEEIGLNGFDAHEKIDIDKIKLLEEILNAATSAKKLCGSLPGAIEDELKALQEPKLKWQDLVKHAFQSIRQDKGNKNDWSRLRRRGLALGLYQPRKKDDTVRALVLLDTSGSMSDDDISYGVSQLKALDRRAKITVVPSDCEPHWKAACEIHSMSDLPKIKVKGRGGSNFSVFFTDYKKHIKDPIDLIIVLTDGFIQIDVPKPSVDVVFVVTNATMPTLPWGRCAPLRTW